MNVQDLATHVSPMLDAVKTSFTDQTTLLQQIKAQNEANGQDNTLVDQAIANIDAVTAQATAAHQAVLAASATVTLSPTTATVAQGATEQFSATTSDGSTPSWSVSPSTVGTIDAAGLFTAGTAAGTGTVVATLANGASASASVTVS